ncbi:sporulation protein YunB [Clostridium weizhouense]|uniref:Sporulation protein YunB n=1 Tax=Clostridium weizhouense TaxID=2859781 RepID=A0ABS7AMT5_9CLOT|nr:sporulation protein YunB [Clostridium weizhouense]MBW6409970.1 sporulation protein YunB [Clostridium weizhouense]
MKYYTRRKKYKKFPNIIIVIITLLIIFNAIMLFLNKKLIPSLTKMSEIAVKSRVLNIINKNSIDIFSQEFNYEEMIKIQKDNDGNINLIQADTIKLNHLMSKLSMECNEELENLGDIKVNVPLGWFTDNSLYYSLGPKVPIRVENLGNINAFYESEFQSAGINQTRHIIYLNVEAKVRIILPTKTDELGISTRVPVSDTIIVGKTPNTAIDFNGNINGGILK